MAIGRVAGPMLLSELDRQGIDLNFTTNSNTLAYLDFSNFKMGINTAVLTETLTIYGNISAGNVVVTANTISTQQNNKSLILAAGESLKLTAGFGANIRVRDDIEWFKLYSTSKGALQKDVLNILAPMQETAEDWYKRTQQGSSSKVYCELKKSVMTQQAERAASAVLGRW